jgi:hypothetical protein
MLKTIQTALLKCWSKHFASDLELWIMMLRGVGWLHGLDEQGIWAWNIVGLNFEFFFVLNHDDVTWDCPKMGDLGKRKSFLNTQFWESKYSCWYFCSRKPFSFFLIYHWFYFAILISFQQNMEFCSNFDLVFSKTNKYKLLQ